MTEQTAKQILARTALNLLNEVGPEFDMSEWARDTPCGMSCCVGGHAYLLEYPNAPVENIMDGTESFINHLVPDDSKRGRKKRFMMSTHWPSDRRQAATRILMYLQDRIPDDYWPNNSQESHRTFPVPRTIRHQLKQFLKP